ncbi:MAG TPA: cytochrome P450 [Pseudonocardiaceae bacterium]|jgi:cytochrome P450|nr:cytochrome P450 [Pseudonocardiaceae bacterium]
MASPSAQPVSIFYGRDKFNPSPELARAQRDNPVSHVQGFWLYQTGEYWMVTRQSDVREVLGDSETFGMHDPDRPPVLPDELLNMDPPEHTRLRRFLTPGFTVKRIRQLAPRIERIIDDHLDAMESRGAPADIVADFALPIPSLVICELLGVPYVDRADFQLRSRDIVNLALPLEERIAAGRDAHEFMAELVATKRKVPDDSLIGLLIDEHGDGIHDAELTGVADVLLIAGHETTSNMLALGTLLLLEHPDQAGLLRTAADDDPVLDRAVEEILRYLTVVTTSFARIARRDTMLGDAAIKAGEFVVCQLAVANRDPALGTDMDRFDITREPALHVTFGHGMHHCLGAPLARMEMRMAFPALLRRFPGLRSVLPVDQVPYRTDAAIYGVDALPVEW